MIRGGLSYTFIPLHVAFRFVLSVSEHKIFVHLQFLTFLLKVYEQKTARTCPFFAFLSQKYTNAYLSGKQHQGTKQE